MATGISIDRDAIGEFCRANHILRLALFGSVLRGEFGADSDVDVLVEFAPEHVPGFFKLNQMEEELSGLLGGRRVDLVTPKFLNRWIKKQVLAEAEVQYAEE